MNTTVMAPVMPVPHFLQPQGWPLPAIDGAAGRMSWLLPATPRLPVALATKRLNNVSDHTKRLSLFSTITNGRSRKMSARSPTILIEIETSDAYSHLHDKAAKFVEMIGGKFAQKLRPKLRKA